MACATALEGVSSAVLIHHDIVPALLTEALADLLLLVTGAHPTRVACTDWLHGTWYMVSRAALALLVELTIGAWHGIGHAGRSFLFFHLF